MAIYIKRKIYIVVILFISSPYIKLT